MWVTDARAVYYSGNLKRGEDHVGRRPRSASVLSGVLLVSGLFPSRPSWAQTLVQQNVDTRVVLAFLVDQQALQRWLPAPWQVDAVATGPSEGANLLVTFIDRLLNQTGDGTPAAEATTRLVTLSVPARHGRTGETALFDIREFNASPQGVPGPYKTGVLATIRREASLHAVDVAPGTGRERWEVKESGGGGIELRLEYQRGVPSRTRSEIKLHSAADPTFFRIYRPDVGTDVVKSHAAGIDRLRNYRFRVTVAELRSLFNGTEELVSLAVLPWYVRQVLLP